jgi:hypothetical protein
MMFADKPHMMAYGSTDQQTLRELRSQYSGLLVPGTIAAFQHQGTGGFVLTLSAAGAPYLIDPRFPLFQNGLAKPKKSHVALAEVLGDPGLVTISPPDAADFPVDRIRSIAGNWNAFNMSYQTSAGGKFDKYAERLGEDVKPENASDPFAILPPYVMVEDPDDPWWEVNNRFRQAAEAAASGLQVVPVVAAKSPSALGPLLTDLGDFSACGIWVEKLHELDSGSEELSAYLRAIAEVDGHRELFALYGGFFSVLAMSVGLSSSSHGIGFGEHRSWLELPRSGPPPARYYLPTVHRYVSVDDAQRLWMADRSLVGCACPHCSSTPPLLMEYHSLMKHSVYCRQAEIVQWGGLDPAECIERLQEEDATYQDKLDESDIPTLIKRSLVKFTNHYAAWIGALASVL